jgi:hypothetical protein
MNFFAQAEASLRSQLAATIHVLEQSGVDFSVAPGHSSRDGYMAELDWEHLNVRFTVRHCLNSNNSNGAELIVNGIADRVRTSEELCDWVKELLASGRNSQ